MNNYKNKYVKLFLKNNLTTEGFIIEWQDSHIMLKASLQSEDILVIFKPEENVIMAKMTQQSLEDQTPLPVPSSPTTETPAQRFERLAELRLLEKQAEMEQIQYQLQHREHTPSSYQVNYEQPNFTQSNSIDDPSKKINRGNGTNFEKLRSMFRQRS